MPIQFIRSSLFASPTNLLRTLFRVTKLRSLAMGSYTASSQSSKLFFRQLFEKESSTYTYLLADVSHPDKPALVSSLPLIAFLFVLQCVNNFYGHDFLNGIDSFLLEASNVNGILKKVSFLLVLNWQIHFLDCFNQRNSCQAYVGFVFDQ